MPLSFSDHFRCISIHIGRLKSVFSRTNAITEKNRSKKHSFPKLYQILCRSISLFLPTFVNVQGRVIIKLLERDISGYWSNPECDQQTAVMYVCHGNHKRPQTKQYERVSKGGLRRTSTRVCSGATFTYSQT